MSGDRKEVPRPYYPTYAGAAGWWNSPNDLDPINHVQVSQGMSGDQRGSSGPIVNSTRARVAVVYQRPIDDLYSGGSTHIRGFISELRKYVTVAVVAPCRHEIKPGRLDSPTLSSIANIIRATWECLLYTYRQGACARSMRDDIILVFDIYAAPIPLIWARVSKTPFIYYAQDVGVDIVHELRRKGYPGSTILMALRLPLERLVCRASEMLVTVSGDMSQRFIHLGYDKSKVICCPIQRTHPVIDLEAIRGWERRLGLHGEIGLVFVGNLDYPPNRSAADFIAYELSPRFSQFGQPCHFILAGRGTEKYQQSTSERLKALGPVQDLSGLLHACHIGLAPLDVAGGVSGKIVDYLIHGLKVVANTGVERGLPRTGSIFTTTKGNFVKTLAEVVSATDPGSPGYRNGIEKGIEEGFLHGTEVRELAKRIQQLQ